MKKRGQRKLPSQVLCEWGYTSKLKPDAEGETHNRLPRQTTGCMAETVLVLAPPVTVNILVADSTSRPTSVEGHRFVDIEFSHNHSP